MRIISAKLVQTSANISSLLGYFAECSLISAKLVQTSANISSLLGYFAECSLISAKLAQNQDNAKQKSRFLLLSAYM
jgi:hypothetical protein